MSTPPALPSASVILLDAQHCQDGPFAVFLLRRRAQSRFMPNRFVFPGGRVETVDGPDPWSPEALAACALRELWEEAGVLLAQPRPGAQPAPSSDLEAARQAMQQKAQPLATALKPLGLAPCPELLRPHARWITPLARPQRYDTMFYLALMPQGQEAACDQRETSQGLWLSPGQALAENLAGRVELAPPQVRLLGELAAMGSLEELLAAPPNLEPVLPVLWSQDSQRVVMLPYDPDYAAQAPQRPGRPCPAHQATRLVHQEGLWLPHCPA